MTKKETNHAEGNAKNHLANIAALIDKYNNCVNPNSRESYEIELDSLPLCIETRSAWSIPSGRSRNDNAEGEYKITLTTGGPALRIIGELSEWAEPITARLEWQDWGTP